MAVVCDVIVAGLFLTIELVMAAAGEEDSCRYGVGHCVCWRARRARFLAGFDRSILCFCGVERKSRREN